MKSQTNTKPPELIFVVLNFVAATLCSYKHRALRQRDVIDG